MPEGGKTASCQTPKECEEKQVLEYDWSSYIFLILREIFGNKAIELKLNANRTAHVF